MSSTEQPSDGQLSPTPFADFGDQRAKDLIDRTEGIHDPRQRIRLLHRALRYGRTGIQARKAFLGLGMAYEDLGKAKRAISYYSKALELGDQNPITRFWRGQLYYRLGDWDSAWQDLEYIAVTHALTQYAPREDRLARRYLAEIAWKRGGQ